MVLLCGIVLVMEKYAVRYRWAFVPAVIILLMWLPGINFSEPTGFEHLFRSVAWILAASCAYIYILNKIETLRHQNIFLVLSLITLPFVIFGILLGGLIGATGIIINSGIPLLILLILGGGTLYKQEGVRTRAIVSILIFIAFFISMIWFFVSSIQKENVMRCTDLYFGTWNETEKRCDEPPDQALRNAIYFSYDITLEDGQIYFDRPKADEEKQHSKWGDWTALLSVSGTDAGDVRFHTDLALTRDDLIFVPLTSEITGNIYLLSLKKAASPVGLFGHSKQADIAQIDGLQITELAFDNDGALNVTVRHAEEGVKTLVFSISNAGNLIAK